jgi:DNA-binding PadR family transcriptional regulator
MKTPQTQPCWYLRYGSGAHIILCYAQMRKTRAFTLSDYKEFQLDRIKSVTISDNIAHLTKVGYLERIQHPNPPNKQIQYMYRITQLGQHALRFVAAKERERFEKKMRKHAAENGKKGALKNLKKQSSVR